MLVIEVPKAEFTARPIYIGENPYKGTYKRNHEGDYHAKEYEVRAMIRDQSDKGNDSTILEGFTMDDIDADTLKRYRIMSNNGWKEPELSADTVMNQVTLKLRVTSEELDKLEEKSADTSADVMRGLANKSAYSADVIKKSADTSVKSVYNNKLSARQEQILKFIKANKENC